MSKLIRVHDNFNKVVEELRLNLRENLGKNISVTQTTKLMAKMQFPKYIIVVPKSRRHKKLILEEEHPLLHL